MTISLYQTIEENQGIQLKNTFKVLRKLDVHGVVFIINSYIIQLPRWLHLVSIYFVVYKLYWASLVAQQ